MILQIIEWLATAVCAASALWLVVLLARDRTPNRAFLNAMAGLEVLIVVHLVAGIVRVTDAPAGVSVWEYVGYLIGLVLVVPAGVVWSSGEQSRGGTGVLLVAMLVVPFMFLRLADIWSGSA